MLRHSLEMSVPYEKTKLRACSVTSRLAYTVEIRALWLVALTTLLNAGLMLCFEDTRVDVPPALSVDLGTVIIE